MNKKSITFGEWSQQVSQMMTRECFKIMVKQGNKGDIVRYVAKEFLYCFVGSLAQQTLEENISKENATEEESYDFVLSNFAQLKDQVQTAVSDAFGAAMSDFTGQEVEYYCQILPIPEVANERPI